MINSNNCLIRLKKYDLIFLCENRVNLNLTPVR